MRFPDYQDAAAPHRPGAADRLLGALGAAVIGVTLLGVRLWARLTRTPYHDV